MAEPKVVYRSGKFLVEDGIGGWRPIDRKADIDLIENLELKLTAEQMATLRAQLGEERDPIGMSPPSLFFQRIMLKNYANGKGAQKFLESGGWDVKQLSDDPWDFQVSRDGGPAYYFDPSLGQLWEETQNWPSPVREMIGGAEVAADMLDLAVDGMIGAAAGAAYAGGAALGAPLGPAGSIAAGSVAAGAATSGLEILRSAMGQAFGVNELDISDAALIGLITSVFSAGVPATGEVVRMAGNKVMRAARSPVGQKIPKAIKEALIEFQAGLTGTSGAGPRLRPERIFEMRAKDRAGILSKIPGIDKKATAMRRLFQSIGKKEIPEAAIAADMEQRATDAGIGINLRKIMDDMLVPLASEKGVKAAELKVGSQEPVSKLAGTLMKSINRLVGEHGATSRKVPMNVAVRVKQLLQDLMDERAALLTDIKKSGKKAADSATIWDGHLVQFQRAVRLEIASMMDRVGVNATDGRNYSTVMHDFARKANQLSAWQFHLGTKLSDPEGIKIASDFIRTLDDTGRGGFREMADELKATTGIDFMKHAERAIMSELFGEGGAAKIFPRISAVGEPVGAGVGRKIWNIATGPAAIGLGGGGIAGAFLTGGPVGAVAGMGIGGMMSSEAGALAINRGMRGTVAPMAARAAPWVATKVDNAVSALQRGLGAKSMTALQAITRSLQQKGQDVEVDEEAERKKLESAR